MKNKIMWLGVALALTVAALVVFSLGERPAVRSESGTDVASPAAVLADHGASVKSLKREAPPARSELAEDEKEVEEQLSPEEKAEAEAEAKVEAFDNLTDKWMDPAKDGVAMKDVDEFVKTFRQVPKDRQDECVHRALNLVPDENVMLLAGILMDKTMDKEIVETVFNDILNRDESVKTPIMRQVYKDKAHPCWTDVAWIFDVTGEK